MFILPKHYTQGSIWKQQLDIYNRQLRQRDHDRAEEKRTQDDAKKIIIQKRYDHRKNIALRHDNTAKYIQKQFPKCLANIIMGYNGKHKINICSQYDADELFKFIYGWLDSPENINNHKKNDIVGITSLRYEYMDKIGRIKNLYHFFKKTYKYIESLGLNSHDRQSFQDMSSNT
tara:strand:- start:2898 stop:3419 length:522 start_codon:yes stop_codon:yes gene_type:complete